MAKDIPIKEWHGKFPEKLICKFIGHKMKRTGWGRWQGIEAYHGHCIRCGYECSKGILVL